MDKYQRADAHTARQERLEEILDRSADQVLDLLEAVLEGRKRVVVVASQDASATLEPRTYYRLEVQDIADEPAERSFDLARTAPEDRACVSCGADPLEEHDANCAVAFPGEEFGEAHCIGCGSSEHDKHHPGCAVHGRGDPVPAGQSGIMVGAKVPGWSAPCDVCGEPGKFCGVAVGVSPDAPLPPTFPEGYTTTVLALCPTHELEHCVYDDGSPL